MRYKENFKAEKSAEKQRNTQEIVNFAPEEKTTNTPLPFSTLAAIK